MKVADLIALKLAESGVKNIYGIPGGPSIPLMESFREAGMDFILTSNEASAGFMADVTARLTGTPGICHATFGPGATNLSTGVGSAYLDRSPVLAITTEMNDAMLHRVTQMNIDHQQLFRPITKATFRLSPSNCGTVLSDALRICREEYPGPVHLGLPSDISEMEGADSIITSQPEPRRYANNEETILQEIRKSKNPVVVAGLTSARFKLGKQITDFCRRNNMPLIVTPMAKSLMEYENPLFAGVLFHALSDYLDDLVNECDLVISIGYDDVEFNYESWLPDNIPLVHFDTKAADLSTRKPVSSFCGTPEEWFGVLDKCSFSGSTVLTDSATAVRNEMSEVFRGFSSRFGPVAVMETLMQELPAGAIVTADVGSHLHVAGQYWKSLSDSGFIITNGWSSMGFGIPAALAAQICNPAKCVVALTGDGGFLMMAGEVVTARRYNLPIIIVVLSDGELNLIKLKQTWKEKTLYATDLHTGELFGSDRFLGVPVYNADSRIGMIRAINTAIAGGEPAIINAVIDPEEYKWLVVRR